MLIYLASPYTSPHPAIRTERFRAAVKATAALMQAGAHVVSPIASSVPVADAHALPDGYAYWQALDRELIDACGELWVLTLPGWDTSVGVTDERDYALTTGKTVRYVDPADVTAPLRDAELVRTCDACLYRRPAGECSRSMSGRLGQVQAKGTAACRSWEARATIGTDAPVRIEPDGGRAPTPVVMVDHTGRITGKAHGVADGFVEMVERVEARTAAPRSTNPKDAIGARKVSLSKLPAVALLHGAHAMANGARKYGAFNWRGHPLIASIYVDACMRHVNAWFDGEENAEDSGVHHLGHALACLAILIDAQATGNLVDDRPPGGAFAATLARLNATRAAVTP